MDAGSGCGDGVGRVGLDESGNDEHADTTAKGTNEEKVATTKGVDEKEDPNEGHDGLDDTEDACGKEASAGSGDTERLEDGGRVVVDGVDTRSVLPQEEHGAEEETPPNLGLAEGLERLPETDTVASAELLNGGLDGGDFLNNVQIGALEVPDPAEVLQSLFTLTLAI